MEKIIHRANERGYADHGWLKTNHSFSFAGWYDANKVRFGTLRVLNDDYVAPSEGFGEHPHDNMEIISIPVKGALAHKDSTGSEQIINTNDVQIMSAGWGLTHSEYNPSDKDWVNFFQIWIFPKIKDIEPRNEQKTFDPKDRKDKIQTYVSPDKNNGTLWINQDAYISMTEISKGKEIVYEMKKKDNGIYVFTIEGIVSIDETELNKRDAMGISRTETLKIKALETSSLLLIEIPMK